MSERLIATVSANRKARRGSWWIAVAFGVAVGVALAETQFREIQSALLVYFLASFWLALPRRASPLAVLVAMDVAPFLSHTVTGTPASWSPVATLVAIALGVGAGTIGDIAFAELDATAPSDAPGLSPNRGMGPRTLLSLALTGFTALGVLPLFTTLRRGGLVFGFIPTPPVGTSLIALRWAQALTLVAWVVLTPALLRLGRRIRSADSTTGLTTAELTRHLAIVTGLAVLHTGALTLVAVLMGSRGPVFLDAPPAPLTLWLAVLAAYVPFDVLTYVAILGLGHITDRVRQAEEAQRRAAALEATAVSARLAALKARLDPHFLYNALNAAVTLARRGQGDATSQVLEELTAILRYALDDTRPRVPLSDELRFAQRYLEIMQLRFGPRLTFSIAADPNANELSVPPLILQPLVENAVEHGVANVTGPVEVRIAAHRVAQGLVVTVEDDGAGPNSGGSPGLGVGLGATRERLAMLFGDRAAVTLSPRVPRGAITELRLPATHFASS